MPHTRNINIGNLLSRGGVVYGVNIQQYFNDARLRLNACCKPLQNCYFQFNVLPTWHIHQLHPTTTPISSLV